MTHPQPAWCPGRFVWWELHTPDLARSKAFYESVAGWRIAPVAVGPIHYTMIHVGEQAIGGLAPLADVKVEGVPPFWTAYVSVPDVDAAAAAAIAAGGHVLLGPLEMAPVGRFAVIQDPQGATLMAFHATAGDPPEDDRPRPGMFCWTELLTNDLDGAAAFCEKVIGWQRRPFFDHAAFYRGERVAAGLDRTPPGIPPVWFSQVHVADLDEARRRTVARGGRILRDEIAIPGVGRMSVILDNVGAVLALFQPVAA